MADSKKILKIIGFSFFLLIIALFGIFVFKEKKPKESKEEFFSSSKLISPTTTNFEEVVVVLKKIDDLTYQILASSYNYDIVGFDFIVEKEDMSNSLILTASSLLSSFSLYQTKKEDFLILTGVKKLNFRQPTVFSETPLVEIKLTKPVKVNLKNTWGKYTSKLVDNQNNILIPRIVLK
jgi:hypothetical protein